MASESNSCLSYAFNHHNGIFSKRLKTVHTCNADLKTRTPSPQSDALDVCVSASDMMPDGN